MSSLVALQEAASDEQERAALNAWIDSEALRADGTVYSALEVEPGWEGAIEQVLSEALSAQILTGRALGALPGMSALPAGAFVLDDQVEAPRQHGRYPGGQSTRSCADSALAGGSQDC